MGPALQAAFLVMNHIGGKLLLFQVCVCAEVAALGGVRLPTAAHAPPTPRPRCSPAPPPHPSVRRALGGHWPHQGARQPRALRHRPRAHAAHPRRPLLQALLGRGVQVRLLLLLLLQRNHRTLNCMCVPTRVVPLCVLCCEQVPDLPGRLCHGRHLHGPALAGRAAKVHWGPAVLLPRLCGGAGRRQAAFRAEVRRRRGGGGGWATPWRTSPPTFTHTLTCPLPPTPPACAAATCAARQRGRRSCASAAPRACASTPFTATFSSAPPTCSRCRRATRTRRGRGMGVGATGRHLLAAHATTRSAHRCATRSLSPPLPPCLPRRLRWRLCTRRRW